MAAGFGNPASQHAAGRRSRQLLEQAREAICGYLGGGAGSPADRLVFTSGGTEANNLAVFGLAGRFGRVIVSAIEHPSIVGPAEELARRGVRVERLAVSQDGRVDPDGLGDLLRTPADLVSVMLANNETGVIQPIEELARECAARGVPMHTDAVQAAGKITIDFRRLGVTALSCSAHKMHGPVGIGGLLLRPEAKLSPQFFGGFQQESLRPGTETVALAAGMHAAWNAFADESHAAVGESRSQRMVRLRNRFEAGLRAGFEELVINGEAAPRVPHTSNVSFPGSDRQELVLALDLAGVCCSSGSACASGSTDPSPVLLAMGLADEVVQSSLRFSLGATTTQEEIDEAVEIVVRVARKLMGRRAG
jgi:cysteine desulfurase